MEKVKYYLVNSTILPAVYSKVIEAKGYLASGEAASASQAAKMAGISRSAYYKYKDAIFEYNGENGDDTATISAKLKDNAGVLSSLMSELYKAGANVLSVNQSMPVNSAADVSVTVRITEMTVSLSQLVDNIGRLEGVNSVSIN
ncbi:MAG: ACT domain-containing protein [Eubacterium sp.]